MKRYFLFFILNISLYVNVCAQDQPNTITPDSANSIPERNRVIGIGIKLFNVISDVNQSQNISYSNKIIFTINPHPHFRIQPEFGYVHSSIESEQINDNLVNNTLQYGLAILYVKKRQKINFCVGIKYLSTSIKNEYIESHNFPFGLQYFKHTSQTSLISFGLVGGGEYLFGTHFSVGTEFGLLATNSEFKDYVNTNEKTFYFSTETNLIVRFYF